MEDSRGIPKDAAAAGMTAAEQLALDAAREAGWQMRWPQLRMMSQSPDLAGGPPETTAAARPPTARSSATALSPGTWRQVLRFVAEVTEVFGRQRVASDGSGDGEGSSSSGVDADAHARYDIDMDADAEETEEAFAGLAGHAGEQKKSFMSSSSSGSSVAGGWNDGDDQSSSAAVRFARRYPLVVLVGAWLAMVLADWLVTSLLAPQLLSLTTRHPWMLSSESLVGRLSLASTDPTGLGLWPALRSGLARGELWLDARVWRLQELVAGTVAPLTRPYALQWLAFSLASLHVLRRCSRLGVRATLACAVYFLLADACLWRVLGPRGHVAQGPSEVAAAGDALAAPVPAPAHTRETAQGASAAAPPFAGVQAPFAEAVELAGAQRRVLQMRRRARVQRLAAWRPSAEQACGDPWMPVVLEFLALAGVYAAAALHVHALLGGASASLKTAAALFALDAGVRSWAGASRYTGCLGAAAQGAAGLAVHVLGVCSLLGLRQAAYAVHSMRVWYATVVRERRRGPEVLAGGAPGVWLATPQSLEAGQGAPAPAQGASAAARSPLRAALAAAGAGGAYAHRVCFLCLSGFCERCLLSMEIWPTTSAAADPAAAPAATTGAAQADAGPHGLPSLRDMLQTFGLLGEASDAAPAAKRGRTLDAWLVSSVAHCPCRHVHGVGPSAFASRAWRQQRGAQLVAGARMAHPPLGTLLPLAAYVAELRRLGLVRPVDPASVAAPDPAVAGLPMIFGRLTAPEHPRALVAANALLASEAASYAQLMRPQQTPGGAPFLAGGRPARILVAPTPLATARAAPSAFRLRLDALRPDAGCATLSVVVTPTLAHVLLAHPRTCASAGVCVPAVLAGAAAAAALPGDCDPFLDHVRVLVPRADVVVRVNGERWAGVEMEAVGRPFEVRGLSRDAVHHVTVSVCGLRSDELRVYLPAERVLTRGDRAVLRRHEYAARLRRQLAEAESRAKAMQAEVRRARRELPRTVQGARADCEAAAAALAKLRDEAPRMRRQAEGVAEHVRRLVDEIEGLETRLEEARRLAEASDALHDAESDGGAVPAPGGVSNFGVLQPADDDDERSVPHVTAHLNGGAGRRRVLEEARRREERARREQVERAEAVRALEDEQARRVAELAQLAAETEPVGRAVDPLRRELADVARRERSAKAEENRLRNLVRAVPRVPSADGLQAPKAAEDVRRARRLLEEEQARVRALLGTNE